MVLLDINERPLAFRTFECELTALELIDKEIKYKYEPVVIMNNIRQCCKIKKANIMQNVKTNFLNDEEEFYFNNDFKLNALSSPSTSTLNTSTTAKIKNSMNNKHNEGFYLSEDTPKIIKLEFKNFPEHIQVGDYLVINEPYMKAFGIISKCEQT